MIKVNNLEKYFNKGKSNQIHVINNTSLDLPSTGLVALLGDSGAGKTTLLNVIGGLDRYNSGAISYDETTFTKYKMGNVDKYRSEHIGYIFQHYNLLPNRTVYDNLALQLDVIDITDPEEVSKRIKYALTAVGLYKFRKKLAGQLSGGQMQRVAIARALVKKTKILIADEPTGNLDSKNSVEIMNILKNISQIALVLLVTHDKPLAEYYSDTIVELKDGAIQNIRTVTNADSRAIKNRLDYRVYLGDMNKIDDGDKIKTVIYSNEENPDINLTLVEINGTYYIKSNVLIKNIEEANVELVNEKYEDVEKEQIEDKFNFDNSWYNDDKKPHPFKRILHELKEAYVGFRAKNKRAKILKAALIVIGVVLAIAFINLYEYSFVSGSGIGKDSYAYMLSNTDIDSLDDDCYAVDNLDISYGSEENFTFEYSLNFYESNSVSYDAYTFQYKTVEDEEILWGNAPEAANDILLGKRLADKVVKKLKLKDYAHLSYVNISNYNICGVTSRDSDAVYSRYSWLITEDYLNDYLKRQYAPYRATYAEYETYKVLEGEDCKTSTLSNPLLVVLDSYLYNSYVEGELDYSDVIGSTKTYKQYGRSTYSFTISGIAVYVDSNNEPIFPETSNRSISNDVSTMHIFNSLDLYKEICTSTHSFMYDISYDFSSGIEMIEGSMRSVSSGYAPCVVAYNSGYEIGDIYTNTSGPKYIVTGIYKYTSSERVFEKYNYVYCSPFAFYISRNSSSYEIHAFEINNSDKQYFENLDIDLSQTIYEERLSELRDDAELANKTVLILAIVMVSICVVYIYFTMRAHMIADIYEIGVLRNIGCSRKRLVGRYAIQSIVAVGTTAIFGYLGYMIIYGGINQYIRNLMGSSGYNLFGSMYPYYGILALFGISLVFGTLPIFTLLGKTPSEISAKYDI